MAGDWSLNILEWVDPVKNEKHELKVPLKDEADWKLLNAGGIAFSNRKGATVVGPDIAMGATLAFEST